MITVKVLVEKVSYSYPWTTVDLYADKRTAENGPRFSAKISLFSNEVGELDAYKIGREVHLVIGT